MSGGRSDRPAVSVVVPALGRLDDPEALFGALAAELAEAGGDAEILVVVERGQEALIRALRRVKASIAGHGDVAVNLC